MTPVQPSAPASAQRFPVLDGLRGVFLILMTLGHLRLAEHGLGLLHPAQVSYVDGAFGFVLLSGIVSGLVYGRVGQRAGFSATARRTGKRAVTLAVIASALIVGLALAAWLPPTPPANWRAMLGPLAHPDIGALAAGALYLQHVDYADILPQYVLYMLLAPFAIWATLSGRGAWALGASAAVWVATQFGGADPAVRSIEAMLSRLGEGLYPPRIFNVMAWQLLFVAGCVMGAATRAAGPTAWRRWAALDNRPLLWVVLTFVAGIAAVNLAEHWIAVAPTAAAAWAPWTSKERLGVVTLLNTAAVAWLVAWFYGVAPGSAHRFTRLCGRLMRRLLHARVLRLLGRHSLLTYVWQVVLIYAVEAVILRPYEVPEPLRSVTVLLVLVSLTLPALIREGLIRRAAASATRLATGAAA